MSRKWIHRLLLGLAILCGLHAHARQHAIEARGELEQEGRLVSGASISVYTGTRPVRLEAPQQIVPSDVVHQETATRIEDFLEESGFVLTSADKAAFHVLFEFGTEEEYRQRLRVDRKFLEMDGRPYYTHYFSVAVTDAVMFREAGETSVVWSGQAILADRSTENPGKQSSERALAILELLRTAALENFGKTQDWQLRYYKEPKPEKN